MQRLEVVTLIDKLKRFILREIERGHYDNALGMISTCANILYQTNIYYMDRVLENDIARIADELLVNKNADKEWNEGNKDTVLFYDGFGQNERGLAQIYLKALCKVKKVIYVTYFDRKGEIPDIIDILNSYQYESFYIKRNYFSTIAQIKQLEKIIKDVRPGHMFFYSVPDDVTATPIMFAYRNRMKRYQINLTDHAFWLGSQCIDKCIEFREYGARISWEYRNIPKEKITIIPFYPIVHYDKPFQGYPFDRQAGQKIFFSGGSLYKTYGAGNRFYQIVDHILETYQEMVFWYAGNGDDTEIKKLSLKYPQRVYLTAERSDLYQILRHCRFYLSTYPLAGGLMFQYAAMAGIVPVTLKYSDCSGDFLIKQSELKVEFLDISNLYEEINKLITDDQYVNERRDQMKKAVISSEIFDEEVYKLMSEENSIRFKADYTHIDTVKFRQIYLERLRTSDLDKMLVRTKAIKAGICYYPLKFIKGGGTNCCKENNYEVSIIVVEYKPKRQALFLTLESLIQQRGLKIQIIVADDGSENNRSEEIVEYFQKKDFYDYKLVGHEYNQGTVKNIQDGLQVADGYYIKLISPGDCIRGEYALRDWILYLKERNDSWSFCDAVYYRNGENGKKEICSKLARPQQVDVYKKSDSWKCRWNYIVLDDIALGAAVICERDIMEKYINRIVDKVKYAEDHIFRLMMFDNIVGSYYPKKVLLYEYGEGISTSGSSIWGARLKADWQAADKIMLEDVNGDNLLYRGLANMYAAKNCRSRIVCHIKSYMQKGKLRWSLKYHLNPRMTSSNESSEEINHAN